MVIGATNSVFERIDLSLLRYFFNVASYGGYSKAARASGISQPALSLGVKRLEKALGTELIHRSSSEFSLTPSGIELLCFCQRMEGRLDELIRGIGGLPHTARRRYRIGTAFSIGCSPLAELCHAAAVLPEPIELEISSQGSFQLLEELHSGMLDAAVVPDDIHDSKLSFTPLQNDRVVFVVGSRYRKLLKGRPWRDGLKDLPLVTYPRDTPMRYLTDRIVMKEKMQFKTVFSVTGIDALKGLLLDQVGGGFVLRMLVEQELETGALFELEGLPISLPRRGIVLATQRGAKGLEISDMIQMLFCKKRCSLRKEI